MSMISEQVNELREFGSRIHSTGHNYKILMKAADTIEALSAKLQEVNMERSTAYYNGGWIPCSERLPEKVDRYYIVSVKSTVSDFEYTRPALYDKHGFATKIDEDPIAWMPLPKSYKQKQEARND